MSDSRSGSGDYQALLEESAKLHGMEPGYWDIWGNWHASSNAVRAAILQSLGVACQNEAELRQSLWLDRKRNWTHALPPVIVASAAAQPITLDLHLRHNRGKSTARLTLRLEDGSGGTAEYRLADTPALESAEVEGISYVRKQIQLTRSLPLGYHDLELSFPETTTTTTARLIVCPERAWLPPALEQGGRRAGLALSLYGVRSGRTWGCGDFNALRGVIDWVAGQVGGSYVALNPLQAIHNRQPYNTSPYLPNSTLYRNFIYLDVDEVEDLELSYFGQALRRHPRIRAEIEALNASEFVEYERVHALKLRLLRALFRTFLQRHWTRETPRNAEFRAFLEQEGDNLHRFALYSALDRHLHRLNPDLWVWPDWPEPYRDPSSPAVAQFAREHPRSILFYKYVQWQLDIQACRAQEYARSRGLDIGLFHDQPLATDRCGFELWANRRFYVNGCRVGAPPDDFAPKGQDWSFPPPDISQHIADGYRLFAETIRKSARHGGALRIDHVMRLFRLYWIPDGFDATQGTYVHDNAEDLLHILALESVRSQILIVGEDLGTVEPSMREMLARFRILSYRLSYFEKHPDGTFKLPEEYPTSALVSSTTHDLPTLAGFWACRDIELRRNLGILDPDAAARWFTERGLEKHRMLDALIDAGFLPAAFDRTVADGPELTGDVHNAVIGFLVSTPSLLMTLNQEDLTKETDQQNLPGTTHEYPNWRRKMRFTVEELHISPVARDFATMFRNWLVRTDRLARG